jgi:hypothetical protein
MLFASLPPFCPRIQTEPWDARRELRENADGFKHPSREFIAVLMRCGIAIVVDQ